MRTLRSRSRTFGLVSISSVRPHRRGDNARASQQPNLNHDRVELHHYLRAAKQTCVIWNAGSRTPVESWYKVTLSDADIAASRHAELQNTFEVIFMTNGGPKGAAMFVDLDSTQGHHFY